jgi:hypothetical protein
MVLNLTLFNSLSKASKLFGIFELNADYYDVYDLYD